MEHDDIPSSRRFPPVLLSAESLPVQNACRPGTNSMVVYSVQSWTGAFHDLRIRARRLDFFIHVDPRNSHLAPGRLGNRRFHNLFRVHPRHQPRSWSLQCEAIVSASRNLVAGNDLLLLSHSHRASPYTAGSERKPRTRRLRRGKTFHSELLAVYGDEFYSACNVTLCSGKVSQPEVSALARPSHITLGE